MKIYLVRHGETTGDIEDRVGGSYDDHLTEKGKQQLEKTAEKLADKNINIIFSSPLIRAQESAEIIRRKLNIDNEVVYNPDLKERHYGVITGLKKDEARTKHPEAMARHHDKAYTHPEGESYLDFYERVKQAFGGITTIPDCQSIAIVGHGGSLKCILEFLELPIPERIGDGEIIELPNFKTKQEHDKIVIHKE